MFDYFFIDGAPPLNAEKGVYDPLLVLASYIVAVFASYAGLTFAAQLFTARTKREKRILHLTGALALGVGIWSMHFIGMLAYKMRMTTHYDPWLTALSMVIAVAVAFFVLQLTQGSRLSVLRLVIGALLLGAGICAMHYTGMAAMKMDASLHYIPSLFFLSVVIAVAASGAALWIVFTLGRHSGRSQIAWRMLAALLMGAAICGMHYTGIAASIIVPMANCHFDATQDFGLLAAAVICSTTILLALLTFAISRRLLLITICSIVLALPLLVIVYESVIELNEHITGVENEEYGIRYHGKLIDLLQHLQEMRGLAYVIRNGDTTFSEKLPAARDGVHAYIAQIDELEKTNGSRLATAQEWENVRSSILVLVDSPSSGTANEEFDQYTLVITALTEFMADIADKSNLTTDTQLATTYLADASVNVAPSIMETVGKMRGRITGLLASGNKPVHWTDIERRELAALYNALEVQDEDLENALERAHRADDGAKEFIDFHNETIEPALRALQKHLEDMIFSQKDDLSPAEVFSQATAVINLYDTLYDKTADAFLDLSKARLAERQLKRNVILYSSIAAALGFVALFVFLYRTLSKTERAERQAAIANVAKSEFLANMSHELRTPLNSILGMNRLLLDSSLTEDQKGLANTVFQSSVNLLEIVNDILDLSKIEAGEMNLERIGFDPKYIFESVTITLSQIAKDKKIFILKSYEKESFPYVLGDPTRFGRILTNLIGNAIKYTDHGHVEIKGSCAQLDNSNTELRCEIIDTGVGIAENKLQSIFEKFVQADTSTTRKYGGTGLGLTITKQLVELMGGKIGAHSMEESGSTFWFTIPFEVTDKLHEEKHVRRQKALLGTVKPNEARILVAEDHPLNQLLTRKMLEKFGIGHFEIVENGLEVLRVYQEKKWDAILMDCHMPEKNGYDTTMEIRRLEKDSGKHVPIVAMTANAMIGDRDKCLRYGMDEYISKPINIDGLKEILSQWIMFNEDPSQQKINKAESDDKDIIDFTLLRTFSEGDEETERELMGIFIEQSDINIKLLNQSINKNDLREFHEIAHKIKGGAASIGARSLAELCNQAQHFSGTLQEHMVLLEKVVDVYGAVRQALLERYP